MKTLLSTTITSTFILLFIFSGTNVQAQSTEFQQPSVVYGAKPYIQLDWKSTQKINYFIIEKSEDGNNYKQSAMVFTDDAITDYKFRDRNVTAASNVVYYRIGLVNNSNELSYLPVKMVKFNAQTLSRNSQALSFSTENKSIASIKTP